MVVEAVVVVLVLVEVLVEVEVVVLVKVVVVSALPPVSLSSVSMPKRPLDQSDIVWKLFSRRYS